MSKIEKINNLKKIKDIRPSQQEAMDAVKTLIRWAGDNPQREGLKETPSRVVRSYKDFFSGYDLDPREILSKKFKEVEGYDEMIVLKNIKLESHCEHHMVPFIGEAHVGYLPKNKVVGLSKLARVVQLFSKRLQIQEKLTGLYVVQQARGGTQSYLVLVTGSQAWLGSRSFLTCHNVQYNLGYCRV